MVTQVAALLAHQLVVDDAESNILLQVVRAQLLVASVVLAALVFWFGSFARLLNLIARIDLSLGETHLVHSRHKLLVLQGGVLALAVDELRLVLVVWNYHTSRNSCVKYFARERTILRVRALVGTA